MDHLHPESMRQLKQLVRLHGAPAIRKAVEQIEAQLRIEAALHTKYIAYSQSNKENS